MINFPSLPDFYKTLCFTIIGARKTWKKRGKEKKSKEKHAKAWFISFIVWNMLQ